MVLVALQSTHWINFQTLTKSLRVLLLNKHRCISQTHLVQSENTNILYKGSFTIHLASNLTNLDSTRQANLLLIVYLLLTPKHTNRSAIPIGIFPSQNTWVFFDSSLEKSSIAFGLIIWATIRLYFTVFRNHPCSKGSSILSIRSLPRYQHDAGWGKLLAMVPSKVAKL